MLIFLVIVSLGCYRGPWLYRNIQTWWHKEVRFPMTTVLVEGNRWLHDQTVLDLTLLPYGMSLFSLDLEQIAHDVEHSPWVVNARVFRRFPSTLVIYVDEADPLALIPGNPMRVVATDGTYLGPIWAGTTWDLPILAGTMTNKLIIGDKFALESKMALINCAQDINLNAPDVYRMISDMYEHGSDIFLTMDDGKSKVRINKDYDHINWDVLEEFMHQKRQDFADKQVQIDLRFPEWVIVSPVKG